jgi:hypothetical protein
MGAPSILAVGGTAVLYFATTGLAIAENLGNAWGARTEVVFEKPRTEADSLRKAGADIVASIRGNTRLNASNIDFSSEL